jgi:hypothetical protein
VDDNFRKEQKPVSLKQDFERIIGEAPPLTVNIVKISHSKLHNELGFDTPPDWTPLDSDGTFKNWNLETDLPLIRYVFRNLQPKRHLEKGLGKRVCHVYCNQKLNRLKPELID